MNAQLNQSRASSRYSRKQNNNKKYQSFRVDPLQLEQQIRSLQDQIQFTICNYEAILETEKKNTAERNQFLLYLIQSMKQKHNQELQSYQNELQNTLHQKQQAKNLQSQMKNIGDGVDSILQQGRKLKQTNQSLLKQLDQQTQKQKQLDEQIDTHSKQIDQLRRRIQEEQINKMKWNIKRKDMLSMIQQAQKLINRNAKVCGETGIQQQNCDHCETIKMKKLMNKYQGNGK